MALATSALIGGIGAAVSGIAGLAKGVGQAEKPSPTVDTTGLQNLRIDTTGQDTQKRALANYENIVNTGGAEFDQASRDLADMFRQYSESGALPTQADIDRSNIFAASTFAPQRVAQEQAFRDQILEANRQAALSGRNINDPVLRARLAQEQTRQNALLQAQQGAFATQFAQQQPKERLSYAEGRTNVLSQALQNRLGQQQNLFALGQNAFGQALQSYGAQSSNQQFIAQANFQNQANQITGGERVSNVLSGVMAGAGAGLGTYSQIQNLFNPIPLYQPNQNMQVRQ